MEVLSLYVQCIVDERKFLDFHFRTAKRQCCFICKLGSGPLLFLLSLSGEQNLLYGSSDHILYGYHIPSLFEMIPQTRNFYSDLFISNNSNYFYSLY